MTLDKRHIAMLKEMGVAVWQNEPPAAAPAATAAETAAPAELAPPLAAASPKPVFEVIPTAIKTIAKTQSPTQATARQEPQIERIRPSGVALMDWATLQQTVANCRACALCEGRKNTVFGVGPSVPGQWLIVGEMPSEQEDLSGEPFVGPAGQLLDNMLKAVGLSREAGAHITNVIKCRPPSNRNPEPQEMAQCEPYLQRQIELLQPKIIIAMGRLAAQNLLAASVSEVQTIPLGKLRGQVHRYQGIPVVVTYHPTYLLRNLPDKAKAWEDLCLAVNVAKK